METIDVYAFKFEIQDEIVGNECQQLWIWCKLDREKPGDEKIEHKNQSTTSNKVNPSNTALIRVANWPTRILIELPSFVPGQLLTWDLSKAWFIYTWLYDKLKEYAPITYNVIHREKFYYYQNDCKSYFMVLDFKNRKHAKYAAKLLTTANMLPDGRVYQFAIFEADYDDIIKFIAYNKLNATGWITIPKRAVPQNAKVSIYPEYFVQYQEIKRNTIRKDLPDFCTSAFDIEQHSHRKNAFPTAEFVEDKVYESSFFTRQIDGTVRQQVHVIGPRLPTSEYELSSHPTEEKLLRATYNSIPENDPDIVSGYNISGYDTPVLDTRWTDIYHNKDIPHLGRIHPVLAASMPTKQQTIHGKSDKSKKGTAWAMPGRIYLDYKLFVLREFADKFKTKTLNEVSMYFLGRGKKHIDMQKAFDLFEEHSKAEFAAIKEILEKWIAFDQYNMTDSELVDALLLKTNVIKALSQYSTVTHVQMNDLFLKGPKFRFDCATYYEAKQESLVLDVDPQDYIPYEGGYVVETKPGKYSYITVFDVKSLYPSAIIAHNLSIDTFIPEKFLQFVDPSKYNTFKFTQKIPADFDGKRPAPGARKKAAGKNRPTKIVEYTTHFVKKEVKVGLLVKMESRYIAERRGVNAEIKVLQGKVKDWEKEYKSNPSPELKARIESTKSMIDILDCRQKALKIVANAAYGALGLQFQGNKSGCVFVAMTITATGRIFWVGIAEKIREFFIEMVKSGRVKLARRHPIEIKDEKTGVVSKVISNDLPTLEEIIRAGDTDSQMNDFLQEDYKSTWDVSIEILVKVNKHYEGQIELELEKVTKMIAIAPKIYAMVFYLRNGLLERKENGKLYIRKKGMAGPRKDSADCIVHCQDHNLHDIFEDKSFVDVYKSAVDDVSSILSAKTKLEDLVTVKRMGASYKSPTYPMAIFGARLKEEGKTIDPGEAISYLITHHPTETLQGYKMFLYETFIDLPEEKRPPIDYKYYANLFLKKITTIWGAVYHDIKAQDIVIGINKVPKELRLLKPPIIQNKRVTLTKPAKFLMNLIEWAEPEEYKPCALWVLMNSRVEV